MVAAVSRESTWPSISSPASATGICGGENATGMGMSGSLGTIVRFLAGERNRARREAGVPLVAAVLAPPQHADERRTDGDEEPTRQRGRSRPALSPGRAWSRPARGAACCRRPDPALILTPTRDALARGEVGLGELWPLALGQRSWSAQCSVLLTGPAEQVVS